MEDSRATYRTSTLVFCVNNIKYRTIVIYSYMPTSVHLTAGSEVKTINNANLSIIKLANVIRDDKKSFDDLKRNPRAPLNPALTEIPVQCPLVLLGGSTVGFVTNSKLLGIENGAKVFWCIQCPYF